MILKKFWNEVMKAVLDMAGGESETVTLKEDHFEELQNMCEELGFRELRQRISRVSWGDLERLEVQRTPMPHQWN